MDEILATFRPDLFAGKRVLISGGTSGIGLCLAKGFARLGAEVTATGASRGAPRRRARRRRSEGHSLRAARRARSQGRRRFRRRVPSLDVLVNAAGVAKPEKEYEEDGFLDVMDVNLNSVMRLSMAARPLLGEVEGLDRQRRLDAELSRRRRRPGLLPPARLAFSG